MSFVVLKSALIDKRSVLWAFRLSCLVVSQSCIELMCPQRVALLNRRYLESFPRMAFGKQQSCWYCMITVCNIFTVYIWSIWSNFHYLWWLVQNKQQHELIRLPFLTMNGKLSNKVFLVSNSYIIVNSMWRWTLLTYIIHICEGRWEDV